MTDDFDFYDLLEIDEDAEEEAVRDAFRERVQEYHPDLNDDPDAPAQFTAIKKAYEILKDPTERQAYDRLGHKDYVAKRTSGIPDPSAWKSDDDAASSSTRSDAASSQSSGTGRRSSSAKSSGSSRSSASSRSSRSSRSASSGDSGRRSSKSRRSSSGSSSDSGDSSRSSNRRATRSSKRGRDRSGTRSGDDGADSGGAASASSANATSTSTARSGSGTSVRAGGATPTGAGGGGTSTTSTVGSAGSSASTSLTDNALFNWWRDRSLGWPLMLSAVLLFVAGVGHWVALNRSAFRSFAGAARAAGTDTAALKSALTTRHGVPTMYEFVRGTELVAVPLPWRQYYAALAAVVVVPILAFAIYRAVWAERPRKWVTMNETVGVAVATAVAATVYGGPLLAGAVVMPFVFLVIIRHTRAAYKFKPTYGYVLGVTVPAIALIVEYVRSSAPIALDLTAALFPVLTVLTLLFSAFVRPRVVG